MLLIITSRVSLLPLLISQLCDLQGIYKKEYIIYAEKELFILEIKSDYINFVVINPFWPLRMLTLARWKQTIRRKYFNVRISVLWDCWLIVINPSAGKCIYYIFLLMWKLQRRQNTLVIYRVNINWRKKFTSFNSLIILIF